MILRARKPSTAIKISKTLFGSWVRGGCEQSEKNNLLSKRKEGEVAWYSLSESEPEQ